MRRKGDPIHTLQGGDASPAVDIVRGHAHDEVDDEQLYEGPPMKRISLHRPHKRSPPTVDALAAPVEIILY